MPVRSAKIRVLDNTLQDRHSQSLRKAGIGDYLLLLSAAGMWGGTFLLNEIALDDFSPVAIAAYRISLAAIILSLICVWKGLLPKFSSRTLGLLTLISLLNSVAENRQCNNRYFACVLAILFIVVVTLHDAR